MLPGGSGLTLRTTSSDLVHPLRSTIVKRSVADVPLTCTALVREFGESMVAEPKTTLQLVETIGSTPGYAAPFRVKVVEAPSIHLAWSVPASTPGPSRRSSERGAMKSTMVAWGDCDVLVFTMIVFTPTLKQGSKPPKSTVTSTATSAKVLTSYVLVPKAPYGTGITLVFTAPKIEPAGSVAVAST